MIRAYRVEGDMLLPVEPSADMDMLPDAVWIDLIEPTADEDRMIEALAGVSIPTREEMREIEESSRFYSENGALYLTMPVLFAAATDTPGIAPVTFVVAGNRLITVRYTSPQPFAFYVARAGKPGNSLVHTSCAPLTVLFGLLESITDRLADVLENVAQRMDSESARMITGNTGKRPMTTADFRTGLRLIGKEGEFLSKVRESLAGLSRLLLYVQTSHALAAGGPKGKAWLKSIERDAQSLTGHAGYLSDRTTFLLDTVVGLVSVEQNAIIKIFSVAAVVFMPPTLVASIYGMNFQQMPELEWLLGYPWAIGLMLVSALLPILYFRSKGWL